MGDGPDLTLRRDGGVLPLGRSEANTHHSERANVEENMRPSRSREDNIPRHPLFTGDALAVISRPLRTQAFPVGSDRLAAPLRFQTVLTTGDTRSRSSVTAAGVPLSH